MEIGIYKEEHIIKAERNKAWYDTIDIIVDDTVVAVLTKAKIEQIMRGKNE